METVKKKRKKNQMKRKQNNLEILNSPELKAIRVITSCYSFEQLNNTRRWLEQINWAGKSPDFFAYVFADQIRKVEKSGINF
jgi:hypothetical protein